MIDDRARSFSRKMINFIDESSSTYHVVKNCSDILDQNGFERLNLKDEWEIKRTGKYYIERANSTIVAFTIGNNFNNIEGEKIGFRIFGAHTDSPGFKVKHNPEMITENLLKINTEVYGSPILNTWFDRPLSIAGRLIVKSDKIFSPKTINIKIDEPILTIPNLAIHQNKDINRGIELDKQNDTLPIFKTVDSIFERENYLLKILAKKTGLNMDNILDFDLFLYATEKGDLVGIDQEFISAPKIDNLASVYTGITGLIEATNEDHINVFVGFDNEEIGSATKQGADSNYLLNILERIYKSLNYDRNAFLQSLHNSFLLSSDGAHAAHPAHVEKSDPTNRVKLNEGIAVKISANQKYTSDGYSIGVIRQLLEGTNIKMQTFLNNSKEIGGTTIGPISSTHLDVDSVDLGVPMLAMHSVREVCGVSDIYDLKELARIFYSK